MRTCLECNSPIEGRSDKKFCNVYCRSAFNYRKNNELGDVFTQVLKALKNNRKILKRFYSKGELLVRWDQLIEAGFLSNYSTHNVLLKKVRWYCCFEYAYSISPDGLVCTIRIIHP